MPSWFSKSWLSCEEYSKRMSRSLDEPLSVWEKLGYRFHHYWCFTCRRFNRQIHQIESGLGLFARLVHSEDFEDEGAKLSSDEITRISGALEADRSNSNGQNGQK